MPVSLPPSLVKGLVDLAALPVPEFDAFLSFLGSIPLEIKQHRVFNIPDFTIPGVADGGQSIKEVAFSLLISRAAGRVPIADFVKQVCRTLELDNGARLSTLHERIAAILNMESLDLVARAHDVLLEHQQTFSSARTVSDIRSVFGNDVADGPAAAVLVHMLSMVYYCDGERNNFVLALDEKDVDQLIDVLERAKAKSAALRKTIESTHVPYIRVI